MGVNFLREAPRPNTVFVSLIEATNASLIIERPCGAASVPCWGLSRSSLPDHTALHPYPVILAAPDLQAQTALLNSPPSPSKRHTRAVGAAWNVSPSSCLCRNDASQPTVTQQP